MSVWFGVIVACRSLNRESENKNIAHGIIQYRSIRYSVAECWWTTGIVKVTWILALSSVVMLIWEYTGNTGSDWEQNTGEHRSRHGRPRQRTGEHRDQEPTDIEARYKVAPPFLNRKCSSERFREGRTWKIVLIPHRGCDFRKTAILEKKVWNSMFQGPVLRPKAVENRRREG